jgi:hypothetical protein
MGARCNRGLGAVTAEGNVRFGSLADITAAIRDVRLTPKSDMPGFGMDVR